MKCVLKLSLKVLNWLTFSWSLPRAKTTWNENLYRKTELLFLKSSSSKRIGMLTNAWRHSNSHNFAVEPCKTSRFENGLWVGPAFRVYAATNARLPAKIWLYAWGTKIGNRVMKMTRPCFGRRSEPQLARLIAKVLNCERWWISHLYHDITTLTMALT